MTEVSYSAILCLSLAVGVCGARSSLAAASGREPYPRVRVNPRDGLKYTWVRPGSFRMGCSQGDRQCEADERPAHEVTITRSFWMGQTEVTVRAFKRFAAATGTPMPPAPRVNAGWTDDDMPVVNVSWAQARAYCAWAGGRLPTEAQWEYAARGGTTGARYGPLVEIAWYGQNSASHPHDVARKAANAFGLFDMLGNVWEWVADLYGPHYYRDAPHEDPPGPGSGWQRAYRGGSWFSNPDFVRASVRNYDTPQLIDPTIGFRCAMGDHW